MHYLTKSLQPCIAKNEKDMDVEIKTYLFWQKHSLRAKNEFIEKFLQKIGNIILKKCFLSASKLNFATNLNIATIFPISGLQYKHFGVCCVTKWGGVQGGCYWPPN